MNRKIAYEETVYAKNLVKLVRKYLDENDVKDRYYVESVVDHLNELATFVNMVSVKKDEVNHFRDMIMFVKAMYVSLLSERNKDVTKRIAFRVSNNHKKVMAVRHKPT